METRDSLPPVELVDVSIETTLGALYVFPDMNRRTLEQMIDDEEIFLHGDLTLANISRAVLVIPIRIIKTLSIAGEIKWKGVGMSDAD